MNDWAKPENKEAHQAQRKIHSKHREIAPKCGPLAVRITQSAARLVKLLLLFFFQFYPHRPKPLK